MKTRKMPDTPQFEEFMLHSEMKECIGDHSVVIHELFPQVNYCKTLENFRENASLNESTIKQPFENCNFRKFRPKLRSPGLNMTFSIHIRDLASVEKSKMFAEV